MSVKVLAFFDTRYQLTPEIVALWGVTDPWQKLREARPLSRQHGALNWPSTLGAYDLSQLDQARPVVGMAKNAGVDGFVVDCLAQGDRYLTGAEAIAPLTDETFGLAFQWDIARDSFWLTAAERDYRIARARALMTALSVGTPVLADGRTILVVDHPDALAEPAQVIGILREAAEWAGLSGLYIIATQAEITDALAIGFDAALDPSPAQWAGACGPQNKASGFNRLEVLAGWRDVTELSDRHYDYSAFAISRMKDRNLRGPVFPRVFPAFQDWLSHPDGGATLLLPGSAAPAGGLQRHYYGLFLENAMIYTYENFPSSDGFVFLQSWNGWCDDSQIEPSALDGDIIYDATRDAIAKGRFLISAKGKRLV